MEQWAKANQVGSLNEKKNKSKIWLNPQPTLLAINLRRYSSQLKKNGGKPLQIEQTSKTIQANKTKVKNKDRLKHSSRTVIA